MRDGRVHQDAIAAELHRNGGVAGQKDGTRPEIIRYAVSADHRAGGVSSNDGLVGEDGLGERGVDQTGRDRVKRHDRYW